MPTTSISSNRSGAHDDWRSRVYQALVGRTVASNSAVLLVIANTLALGVTLLVLLFWTLGAAMAAGTTTPGLDVWISRMLWTLGVAAAAFAWVILQAAFGRRWPWAVQYLAGAAILLAILLYVFAPAGVR